MKLNHANSFTKSFPSGHPSYFAWICRFFGNIPVLFFFPLILYTSIPDWLLIATKKSYNSLFLIIYQSPLLLDFSLLTHSFLVLVCAIQSWFSYNLDCFWFSFLLKSIHNHSNTAFIHQFDKCLFRDCPKPCVVQGLRIQQ